MAELNVYKTSGIFHVNTYHLKLQDREFLIDPGFGISKHIDTEKVYSVILTHGHYDHISGLKEIKFDKIYISNEDKSMLSNDELNYSALFGRSFSISIEEGIILDIDEELDDFVVLKAPGHTYGSRVIIYEDKIFTGDTVFPTTIGRTDLNGSRTLMTYSLRMLKDYFRNFQNATIYPGHEEPCSVKRLLALNPYFK